MDQEQVQKMIDVSIYKERDRLKTELHWITKDLRERNGIISYAELWYAFDDLENAFDH